MWPNGGDMVQEFWKHDPQLLSWGQKAPGGRCSWAPWLKELVRAGEEALRLRESPWWRAAGCRGAFRMACTRGDGEAGNNPECFIGGQIAGRNAARGAVVVRRYALANPRCSALATSEGSSSLVMSTLCTPALLRPSSVMAL